MILRAATDSKSSQLPDLLELVSLLVLERINLLTCSKLEPFTFIKAMYVCISQACLTSHSLSSKIFCEIVHLTFQNIDFSIKSPSNILGKLEALLKEPQTISIYFKGICYLRLFLSINYNLFLTSCALRLAHMTSFVNVVFFSRTEALIFFETSHQIIRRTTPTI